MLGDQLPADEDAGNGTDDVYTPAAEEVGATTMTDDEGDDGVCELLGSGIGET